MSCALTRNNWYIHEYREISKGNEWKGGHKTYAITAWSWNLRGKPNIDKILKNSLWRQKTEEKEQESWSEWRHILQHHTSYSTACTTAQHTPWHCNTTSLHSLPTATNILPIQPHHTYQGAAHFTAPQCTSHHTAMYIPLHHTSHCQASQSECIPCPETWASIFHRTSLPCMTEDSSTH